MTDNNNTNKCAEGIKDALSRRGMTQRELAERLGQHPVALNATIRNGNMQVATLVKIAEAIGCDVTEFFGEPAITVKCPHCGKPVAVDLKAT